MEENTASGIELNVKAIPNPSNSITTISYQLPSESLVDLKVYDMYGRQVSVLVQDRKNAGTHSVQLDASNLNSGVYICRLRAGTEVVSERLIIVK